MSFIFGVGATCTFFAWWVVGIVWRFRSDGSYTCGDVPPEGTIIEDWDKQLDADSGLYQYRSGRFMLIFYLIGFIMIAISCACSIIGAICTCIKGEDKTD